MTRKYTCQRCGAPGHGKDDCGKTKPISGPVAAIGLIEEKPQSVDLSIVHELYEMNVAVRTDGDFLAPTTNLPPSLLGNEGKLPKDLQHASNAILDSFGANNQSEREKTLTDSVNAIGLHRDTHLVPPDEAAAELSSLLGTAIAADKRDVLLDKVRSGEITLTGSEIAILHGLRDELLVNRAEKESASDPFDGNGVWSPPYENRQCTVCGQFVGKLGSSHGNCPGHSWYGGNTRPRSTDVIIPLAGRDGEVREEKVGIEILSKDYWGKSVEEQQDAYLAAIWRSRKYSYDEEKSDLVLAERILGQYIQKGLFKEPKLVLPRGLREAYLAGGRRPRIRVVASLIDPPFTSGELEHLIDTDPSPHDGDTWCLIQTPRTRDEALRILENSPSDAGASLAAVGALPTHTVRNMSESGDPIVRVQAASAKNLPGDAAERLATDPDPDVRKKMVSKIKNYPETLHSFVNDPDEEITLKALASFPGDRNAVVAIGKITSRKRLQAIRDKLPDLWIPKPRSEWSEALGMMGPHREVEVYPEGYQEIKETTESVQEWIRSRLARQ